MSRCTRATLLSDHVGAPCPNCGHTTFVHPGVVDPAGAIAACVLCDLADQVRARPCEDCGALVVDEDAHRGWHDGLLAAFAEQLGRKGHWT